MEDQGVNANTQSGTFAPTTVSNALPSFSIGGQTYGTPPPTNTAPAPTPMTAKTSQTVQQLGNWGALNTVRTGLTPTVTADIRENTTKTNYVAPPGPNALQQIGNKAYNIVGSVGRASEWALGKAYDVTKDAAMATYHFAVSTGEMAINTNKLDINNMQGQMLLGQQDSLEKALKSGTISTAQYYDGMDKLTKQLGDVNNNSTLINTQTDAVTGGSQQYIRDTIGTMTTILSLGGGEMIAAGVGKLALGEASTMSVFESIGGLLGDNTGEALANGASKVAQLITKVPGFSNVVNEALGKTLGDVTDASVGQMAKDAAVGLLIKRPLFYQANVGTAVSVYKNMQDGKYGSALFDIGVLGLQAVGGGPFGWAKNQIQEGWSAIGAKMFPGGNDFADFWAKASSMMHNGDVSGFGNAANELKGVMTDAEHSSLLSRMSEVVATNMKFTKGDSTAAAKMFVDHFSMFGDMSNLTHVDILQNTFNWAEGNKFIRDSASKFPAFFKDGAEKFTTGAFNTQDKTYVAGLVKTLADTSGNLASSDKEQMWSNFLKGYIDQNPYHAWTNNMNTVQEIKNAFMNSATGEEASKAITSLTTASQLPGVPKEIQSYLQERGLTLIRPQEMLRPFVPVEEAGKVLKNFSLEGNTLFDQVKPVGILSHIGTALTNAGMSPIDSSNLVRTTMVNNFADHVQSLINDGQLSSATITDAKKAAGNILAKLNNAAQVASEGRLGRFAPITDLRQMPIKMIESALTVSSSEAKSIAGALNQAMIDVPMSLRGLGDRIVDYNMKYNPLAAPYARLQGGLRFGENPFFRFKLDVKTEAFAQAEAGGKSVSFPIWNKVVDTFFPGQAQQLDNTVSLLKDSHILSGGFSGEGAQDLVLGGINADITKSQGRSIAGFVQKMAQNENTTVETLIKEKPQQVADAARILVQYPRESIINSPLARTINTVFFPARFEMKVAALAADVLAKQAPFIQVAVMNGLYNANQWLKTPEGTAWQSQNADAIGILKWASPIDSIQKILTVLNSTVHGKLPESVGTLGELGGLPFGIIGQILDANNIVSLNTPYVDMKTGTVMPKYVPNTLKAQASQAIQSFIGSVFTYPGATAGLPSKGSIIRNAVNDIPGLKTSSKDVTKVDQTSRLTPLQAQQSQQIKDAQKPVDQAVTPSPISPDPYSQRSYAPKLPMPQTTKLMTKKDIQLASGTGSRRTKKIARPIQIR